MTPIASLWDRIESHMATLWPTRTLNLRPPATEAQITAAESVLGLVFPADFRASVLVHDGQEGQPEASFLPGVHMLGSLQSIVECWVGDAQSYVPNETEPLQWFDEVGRTHQVHSHPRRISFAGSPHWDYDRLLFDFDPAPRGRAGQIIIRRGGEFSYVCESWRELLEGVVAGLEGAVKREPR